jgi:hypothetical protein
LSVLERLLVEELLWRDPGSGSWLIAGHHDPTRHRYLSSSPLSSSNPYSADAVIVMGIGGKPHKLLDLDLVRRDNVQVLRRFSGGGTVVLDADSIWTTVIGRNGGETARDEDDDDEEEEGPHLLPPDRRFPRPIMEWSMSLFGPVVDEMGQRQRRKSLTSVPIGKKTMVLDTKSCAAENTGRVVTLPLRRAEGEREEGARSSPSLSLRENDYVVDSAVKVAGNAQSIGRSGWLHHTSWLWDYSRENMEYLRMPERRPEYREGRPHGEFLGTLRSRLPALAKSDFYECLRAGAASRFDLTAVSLPAVMGALRERHGDDVQGWARDSRTKVVTVSDL